jgi:hypothetical protein
MTVPEHGTPEWETTRLLVDICIAAPERLQRTTTQIYSPKITAAREHLETLGIDWRKALRSKEERQRKGGYR